MRCDEGVGEGETRQRSVRGGDPYLHSSTFENHPPPIKNISRGPFFPISVNNPVLLSGHPFAKEPKNLLKTLAPKTCPIEKTL